MPSISGPFTIAVKPLDADPRPAAAALGRLSLDKTYTGPLSAVSMGQMLAYRSTVDGSAGYVAIEVVTGSVDGRAGSFALQHSGRANRGEQLLTVEVIADSGSGDLVGLSGAMTIVVADGGSHSYVFEYAMPS